MFKDTALYTLRSDGSQQNYCDTTSDIHTSTIGSIKHEAHPSIAITPPDHSPSNGLPPNSYFEDECTQVEPGVVSRVFVSVERAASGYNEGATRRRGRPRSPSGVLEERYCSISPHRSDKRYGMINIASLNDAAHGRCTSMNTSNTEESRYDMVTDECHSAHPTFQGDLVKCEPSAHQYNAAPSTSSNGHRPHLLIDAGSHELYTQWNSDSDVDSSSTSPPIAGKWRCCECQRAHDTYRLSSGEHLISILSCLCKHRSCRSCNFHGNVKRFAPIDDVAGVASVPVAQDDGNNSRFGVVCRTCGLSWRAKTIKRPKDHVSLRRRLSVLPKKVNPLQKLRHTRSMIHLGLSRDHHPDGHRPATSSSSSSSSLTNLRSVSDSQAKGATIEQQAQGAEVRFYGINCTCGTVTDSRSLCFQIMDSHELDRKGGSKMHVGDASRTVRPNVPPELMSKGYGTPILYLKGGCHPNPLFSHPVRDSRQSCNGNLG